MLQKAIPVSDELFTMAHSELDSFFFKFKNLRYAEKDVTLTFKSEAGRALVTLSLDLGHVHSGHAQPPGGHRNGPARQRRRENRAAARLEKDEAAGKRSDAEEARNLVKPTEEVSETYPDAEQADKVDSIERAETAPVAAETKATFVKEIAVIAVVQDKQANDAAKADIAILKEVEDEFCPDDEVGRIEYKERSVATQTLETGTAPTTTSKFGGDFYTLTYEDYPDSE